MNVLIIVVLVLGIVFSIAWKFGPSILLNVSRLFACPNCGHKFSPKWYDFGVVMATGLDTATSKLKLKCPKCEIRDWCGPPSL